MGPVKATTMTAVLLFLAGKKKENTYQIGAG
jgi:hypothetical protein